MRSLAWILALSCALGGCAQLGRLAPPPLRPRVAQLEGRLVASEAFGGSRGAIVYLEPVAAEAPPADAPPTATSIRRGRFDPDPAIARVGSRVAWTNADSIYHGVFSLTPFGTIDLGVFGPGERRELALAAAGPVRVHCPIHVDEAGIVFAVPSPYFVRVARSGRYALQDVPPGRYWLRAWSDGWSATPRDVTLRPGESAHADVRLLRESP